jgi:tRNA-Thr(GGU) m(6)t(6)A37 methyltransferase TsaA
MNRITYYPIGIAHTPFRIPEGTPIQAVAAKDIQGKIEIFPEYAKGLKDLEGFSHIIVLFHLHFAKFKSLHIVPFLDTESHGVFATRSPARPNPIGFSVVELEKVENNMLFVKNIDILDGSPILDIKPYIPQFDVFETTRNGWFEANLLQMHSQKDDGRFAKPDCPLDGDETDV